MSKKKVIAIYPDAGMKVEVAAGFENATPEIRTYTVISNITGYPLSHSCSSPQSAWRSALAMSEGKVSRKKGDKPGRKEKMSIRVPPEMKERIEKKHGSIQAFINHHAAKLK
jgi:hypothetical protein